MGNTSRELTSLTELEKICTDALTYKTFDVDKSVFKDYEVANPCGRLARDFPQDDFKHIKNTKSGLLTRNPIRH